MGSFKDPRIQQAILEGNRDKLRAAGRKGAQVRARNIERKLDIQETLLELRAERTNIEEYWRQRQANEHIIPVSTYD